MSSLSSYEHYEKQTMIETSLSVGWGECGGGVGGGGWEGLCQLECAFFLVFCFPFFSSECWQSTLFQIIFIYSFGRGASHDSANVDTACSNQPLLHIIVDIARSIILAVHHTIQLM